MRRIFFAMLGIVLVSSTAWGMRTRRPPTLTDLNDKNQLVELNNYLSEVYELTNGRYTLENLDVTPQDVRKGQKGDLVYATYGGVEHLCINTSFPAAKDWTCVNVETLSTCPGGDNQQIQYNRNGTCMGDLAFIFNEATNSVGIGEDVITPVATLEIDPADTTVSGEVVSFRSSAQTLTFASDGSTVTNQRQNQFYAPIINGIAGGGTETVTNSATFYISGEPSGSNVTFSNDPLAIWVDGGSVKIDEATDGDSVLLRLENDQANVAGSTNERAILDFAFGGVTDVGQVVASKLGNYTSANNRTSAISIWAERQNTLNEVARFAGSYAAIGTTTSGASLTVGNTSYDTTQAVVFQVLASDASEMIYVRNADTVQIGDDQTSPPTATLLVSGLNNIGSTASAGILYILGDDTHDSPAQIQMASDANGLLGSIQMSELGAGALDYPNARFLSFANTATTNISQEDPNFVFEANTETMASGDTNTNHRIFIIEAPTINGVAGGPTETVTNAATFYIEGAPSGLNITFTNGPYAMWVDGGKSQFDGTVQLGQNGASGQLVIYAELGGTDYTTTINPSASQSQNITYTLPPDDGTASGILVTDGSGGLSWNNAGTIAAGQWTPTTNNIANLDSSSAGEGQYLRVGNSVSFSVRVNVNPTLTATSTQLELDLPVASNFGSTDDVSGSCAASGVSSQSAALLADSTSDEIEVLFVAGDVTDQPMYCVGVYQII